MSKIGVEGALLGPGPLTRVVVVPSGLVTGVTGIVGEGQGVLVVLKDGREEGEGAGVALSDMMCWIVGEVLSKKQEWVAVGAKERERGAQLIYRQAATVREPVEINCSSPSLSHREAALLHLH